MARPPLTVVLPLYNEAHCLAANLAELQAGLARLGEQDYELLLVDDGSLDQTRALAAQLAGGDARLRLLDHAPNRGKGYSVRQGVLAAAGDQILFLDADLSTPVDELPRLRQALDEQDAQIAIGSRAMHSSELRRRQPWPRETLGRLGNFAIRCLTPSLSDLRDTQCGFKLLRRDAARDVFAASRIDRWGFDFEILALARAHGLKVVEVGVCWRHDPHSKVRPLDYLRTLGDLLRLRLRLRTL